MTALLDRPKARNRDEIDDEPVARLPERYEVINGEIVEVEPMSGYAGWVANRLNAKIIVHLERKSTGQTLVEVMFRIPLMEDQGRHRIPDLAYLSFDRWPADRPVPFYGNPIDVVPDLAVEVVSPNDIHEEVVEKVHEYLRAGVRLVWLVMPKQQQVIVYRSLKDNRTLDASDILDGGDVLPGFEVNVGSLFPPIAPEPPR